MIDVGSGSRAWVWSGIVNLRGDESQIAIVLTVPAPPPTLSPVSQPNNNSQLSSSENENLNCDTSFSRLNIGSLAEVTGPSSIAVISSSGEVIDYAPIGAVVRVLSGPRCTSLYRPNNPNGSTDGIGIQWEVQIGSSVVGYVIEYNLFGNDLTYTLQPK